MSRSHEERRKVEYHKFISKIKKVFNSNTVLKSNYHTWNEMAKDRYGLLFKHTRTPISNKCIWKEVLEKRAHHKEKVIAKKAMTEEANEYNKYIKNSLYE